MSLKLHTINTSGPAGMSMIYTNEPNSFNVCHTREAGTTVNMDIIESTLNIMFKQANNGEVPSYGGRKPYYFGPEDMADWFDETSLGLYAIED